MFGHKDKIRETFTPPVSLPEDFPFEVIRAADKRAAIVTAGKRYVLNGWATTRDEFYLVADENYTGLHTLSEALIAHAVRDLATDVQRRAKEARLLGMYPPKTLA
jgi:hypothetical protein